MVKGFPIVTMEERMIVKRSLVTPLLVSTVAVTKLRLTIIQFKRRRNLWDISGEYRRIMRLKDNQVAV